MKTSIRLFISATTIIQLFCLQVNSQSTENPKYHNIDSLLTSCNSTGIFNGIALVADEGKIILHKAYGTSDMENQTPLKLNDRFYIGSLTKQFTSVLILQLQEDELIDISNPISLYLEEFKDSIWAHITIHHLLTHTSGLGSYTSHPDFNKSIPYTDKEMFDFIKHPLIFEAGTDWSYSNSGYFLLGKIAERVTKKHYGLLLEEKIFKSLEMNSTSFSEEWIKTRVAKGYRRTVDGIKPMPSYSPLSLFSTGGIYSTAQDLFIWTQALNGNQLLTDESKKILFQPVRNDYACGFYVKRGVDQNGNKYERHYHGGIIQGYHSFILKRVPQKQVVILLDNFHSQEIQTIKNRIWSALIEEEIKWIKPQLSFFLFKACANNTLIKVVDSISNNLSLFETQYTFEEFDINTVGYRLMESDRLLEAHKLFEFNKNRYPESWNVYDSMGELLLKQRNYEEAEKLYKKSLVLNPQNTSAERALKKIAKTSLPISETP